MTACVVTVLLLQGVGSLWYPHSCFLDQASAIPLLQRGQIIFITHLEIRLHKLVFCCHRINYHKFSRLKQHSTTPIFWAPGMWAQLSWVLSSGSHKVTQGTLRTCSHLELRVLLQASVRVGRIQFLTVVGLRPSAPVSLSMFLVTQCPLGGGGGRS